MGFFSSIRSVLFSYANFKGGASARELWNWLLFVILLALAASSADLVFGVGQFAYPALLLLALPTLAVFTRYARANRENMFKRFTLPIIIILLIFFLFYAI